MCNFNQTLANHSLKSDLILKTLGLIYVRRRDRNGQNSDKNQKENQVQEN